MKEERKQLDQISEYLEKVGSSENKLEDSALFFEYPPCPSQQNNCYFFLQIIQSKIVNLLWQLF